MCPIFIPKRDSEASVQLSKAKELLGWTPKVSLEEGIKRTEEWIRSTLAT